MINSKICKATLLLPLAGALQQMRLATSSTMAPHWQPKPAPAPLVDAPAAPALSVEAAMRIMFDPVGRGKVRTVHTSNCRGVSPSMRRQAFW